MSRGGKWTSWLRGLEFVAVVVACGLVVIMVVSARWTADEAGIGEVDSSDDPLSAEVFSGSAESRLDVVVDVTWVEAAGLVTGRGGRMTEVLVQPGEAVATGTELAALDGVPLQLLVGPVPPYRELSVGDEGPDVLALQEFLVATGHSTLEPDGLYASETASAVLRWRRAIGDPIPSPTFAPESVVWSAAAGVVALDPQLGDEIAPLTRIGSISQPVPRLRLSLPGTESPLRQGQSLTIELPSGDTLEARLGQRVTVEDGVVVPVEVEEEFPQGVLPITTTALSGVVEVQPLVEGISIPAGAVQTRADGQTYVVHPSGQASDVQVLARDGGTYIVDGIRVGDSVLLSP